MALTFDGQNERRRSEQRLHVGKDLVQLGRGTEDPVVGNSTRSELVHARPGQLPRDFFKRVGGYWTQLLVLPRLHPGIVLRWDA